MKCPSAIVPLVAALAWCCTTEAFLGTGVGRSFAVRRGSSTVSSSALNMVADDAKVVVVTGSSRGLGKAIALDIGMAGQKVVVNYVSEGSKQAAQDTVAEIVAAGGDAIAVKADSTFPPPHFRLALCLGVRSS